MGKEKIAKAGSKPPLSAHPAFPMIVALWFAALLGLGSFVLPTVLLEKMVTAIGLPAIVEATAPPLGFKARAIIALGAAILGAIVGVVIARRVRDAQAPAQERARSAAGDAEQPRKAFLATEELDAESIEQNADGSTANPAIPGRRRSLTNGEEDGAPSLYLDRAPVPGDEDGWDILPTDDSEPAPIPAPEDETTMADESSEPLDLDSFAASATSDDESRTELAGLHNSEHAPAESAADEQEQSELHDASSLEEWSANASEPQLPEPEPERQVFGAAKTGLSPMVAGQPDEDTEGEAAEDASSISMSGPGDEQDDVTVDAAALDSDKQVFGAASANHEIADSAADDEVEEQVDTVVQLPPLASQEAGEGLGDLVTRLETAFADRKSREAERIKAAADAAAEAAQQAAATSDPAAQDTPDTPDGGANVKQPTAVPAPFASLSFGGDDEFDDGEDDDVDSLSMSLRLPVRDTESVAIPTTAESQPVTTFSTTAVSTDVAPAPTSASAIDETAESAQETARPSDALGKVSDEALESGYSSLLNLSGKQQAPSEFVRVEEPEADVGAVEPAVVFPGQQARQVFQQAPQDAAPISQDADNSVGTSENRPDSDEADRALRAALSTLQKMG